MTTQTNIYGGSVTHISQSSACASLLREGFKIEGNPNNFISKDGLVSAKIIRLPNGRYQVDMFA